MKAGLEPTLDASHLVRDFGARHAVQGISVTLRRGEVLGLLGPNGAGKTTTMQMLTGNLAPTSGEIRVCGIDLLDRPTQAKARIGYLPETPPLYRDFSVDEYLQLAARLHRVPRRQCAEAVARAKRRCGLADRGGQLIATLSKGYQQRVGIAQAIVHDPDVVVLDEPTVGLDPNQIREIRTLIRELAAEHSVMLSSHWLTEVETVCDRVQILNAGKVVYTDTIEALRMRRDSHALTVAFRKPPDAEELSKLPGVSTAEALSETRFRLYHEPGADPTDVLVRRAVERDWGLRELSPLETTLEEVFVGLTQRDESVETP